MIEKLKFNDVCNKLDHNELSPYNFYNIDIGIEQFYAKEHYLKHPYDTIDESQPLKKVFLDIELFLDHNIGSSISECVLAGRNLVNAVSQYYSSENCYYCYLVPPKNCKITAKEFEEYIITESLKPVSVGFDKETGEEKFDAYLTKDQKVKVVLFQNGIDLVHAVWEKIKSDDPAVLSGWNADTFDFPYLYHYLLTHYGGDHNAVAKVMSNFGEIQVDDGRDRAGNTIHWLRFPDFNIVDLLYSYKSRDDGGLGLGKKLRSYALNNVAYEELKLKKFEYKLEGLTLDQLYEQDPLNFLIYNMWDTALCYKIDNKTGMIDLYNTQRRKMNTPLGMALKGSSPLFDTFIYKYLSDKNEYIRWGINNENMFGISKEETESLPLIKSIKKIKWSVDSITPSEISKMLNKFAGAYVKDPVPGIYDTGIISDLDASRL